MSGAVSRNVVATNVAQLVVVCTLILSCLTRHVLLPYIQLKCYKKVMAFDNFNQSSGPKCQRECLLCLTLLYLLLKIEYLKLTQTFHSLYFSTPVKEKPSDSGVRSTEKEQSERNGPPHILSIKIRENRGLNFASVVHKITCMSCNRLL